MRRSRGTGGTSGKQETEPVWHAGPLGSTVTTRASRSQSSAMWTTRWVLPLVAPLCQSSWRLRLQNQVWPVSRVLASDSSFM